MKQNSNIFDEGHPDMIDLHWEAVCHHGHTVMFDESEPFTFLLGEKVRSIPSALIPEPSVKEWEEAGFTIEQATIKPCGVGGYAHMEDRAKEGKARNASYKR